jgi:cytosine deaminase
MAEARYSAVANPLINITLQGRHDTYPKRRGMTRVPELLAAGCQRGLWPRLRDGPLVQLGSGDMLEVAHMGLHVGQMTSQDRMRQCFDAVTVNAARVLGLEGYGIAPAATPTLCCCRRAAASVCAAARNISSVIREAPVAMAPRPRPGKM